MQIFLSRDLPILTAKCQKFKTNSHKNFLCGHVEHSFDNSAEKSFLKIRKNIEIYKPSSKFFPKKTLRIRKTQFWKRCRTVFAHTTEN